MPPRRPTLALRDLIVGGIAIVLVVVILLTALRGEMGEDAGGDRTQVAQSFADASDLYQSLRGRPRLPTPEECSRLRAHWLRAREGLSAAPVPSDTAADSVTIGLVDTAVVAVPDSAELAARLELIAAFLEQSCED